jgi:thiol:disulfide interchange protein DsbA
VSAGYFLENKMLKQLVTGLIVLFAAGLAQAQPTAGTEYRALDVAQPTDSPGKIEVIEFFWYGCPHCHDFEPVLEPWVKKLPKDVHFRRVPAMFNDEYARAARAFYALDAMGEEERLHKALFDAVHTGARLRVGDEAALTEWLGKHDVDTKKFAAAYRSFSVESKLKRATQLTQMYKIDGVPSMAVNGKYVVNTDNIRSFEQLLAVTDYLIEQVRKQGGDKAVQKK